ncbi:MAG: hypothetical protein ACK58T_15130, partial [Phycisphaerae bacterium]
TDTAIYWNGNRADYNVTDHGFGIIEISGSRHSDFLTNIEQVQFQDGTYSLSDLLSGRTNEPALGTDTLDAEAQTIDSPKTPTEGSDVLVTNENGESIDALGGDDLVVSLGNQNTIKGSAGNDAIVSTGGNNFIDGGAGKDTVVYSKGSISDYSISSDGDVTKVSSIYGEDTLKNIERLSFS